MFSDETNNMIQEAMDYREMVVTARTEAKGKTTARTAAQEAENAAVASLGTITSSATEARKKALDAVAAELAVPAEEEAPPKAVLPLPRASRNLQPMSAR